MTADLRLPEPAERADGNVADLLAATARRGPSTAGLATTGTAARAMSWPEVDRAVDAKARELLAADVRPGDRVATVLARAPEFVVSLLALLRCGAVAVPLSPYLPVPSMRALLEHSGAGLLISDEYATGTLPSDVGVVGGDVPPEPGPESASLRPAGAADDTALIAYVAGVDSPPRGAMYSHRALVSNAAALRQSLDPSVARRERVLLAVPLAHLYSIVGGLLPALSAGWSVLLPGDDADASQVTAASAAHRATMIVGSPAMYTELSGLGQERLGEGLATVSTLLCGPTPAHSRVQVAMRRATGLDLTQCYGRADVAGVLTTTLGSLSGEPAAVGHALPGSEVRLVDSDGEQDPVALDPADPADVFSDEDADTGLIVARGPSLSAGHWPNGEFGPDAGGWARTGDVGYLDASGELHLLDRASDLIVINGFNVYPREVEQVIATMPEVAEVAVLGVREEGRGETVRAVVVPTSGAEPTREHVIEHCTAELPAYKVPSAVRFAGELPRTPTGMLRRNRMDRNRVDR